MLRRMSLTCGLVVNGLRCLEACSASRLSRICERVSGVKSLTFCTSWTAILRCHYPHRPLPPQVYSMEPDIGAYEELYWNIKWNPERAAKISL